MGLFDSAPVLRPYQTAAIEQLDAAIASGSMSPLMVLPTGAGKTVIAGEVIRRDPSKRSLFLAPRRELVTQTSEKLRDCGVEHGVIMAGAEMAFNMYAPVQVASIDTLLARRHRLVLPSFDQVIVDEAHLSITETRQNLLNEWPNAVRIGLTATPTRKDGKALGLLYDRMIQPTTVQELTELGYLVPARYFSISKPDLERVRITGGDYNSGELAEAMNNAALVGDIVQTWLANAGSRRTVVFCCSIEHSVAVTDEFLRNGVAAEHVDAKTPQHDRDAIFARFKAGKTQVLTNCFLASYGFDLPALSCVVLARPTKSLMLYLQMLGRGLRIAEGKSDCLVLDHSGCVHMHGFAADPRAWTLEGDRALLPPEPADPKEKSEAKRIECPECSAVFSRTRTCPECGFYIAPKGRVVETIDGELIEIGEHEQRGTQERMAFFLELRGIASERGYQNGWAAHKYKEKHREFPPFAWNGLPVLNPTVETRRWVKSRQIAWAKSKQKRAATA